MIANKKYYVFEFSAKECTYTENKQRSAERLILGI